MEWFEEENFWRELYPFMFPDSRIEKAEPDSDFLIELTNMKEGDVLDLCCGPGRFSIAMAKRGFTVTGVDRTEYLLEMARRRASLEDLSVEWVLEDMRSFIRPDSFDLTLCMFTSFGYFEKHEENMKVLHNVRDSLRQGGILVLELMGKEVLASIFSPVSTDELENGKILVQKHRIEDGWRKIHNEWLIIEDDRVKNRWKFSHWVYSAAELEDMLKAAGFSVKQVYGSIHGIPYDSEAARLVVIAVAE